VDSSTPAHSARQASPTPLRRIPKENLAVAIPARRGKTLLVIPANAGIQET
jgi:hypothetical protein